MKLNRKTISENLLPSTFSVPHQSIFTLPEKVLQFGTGVLLRGLPDFYIDKANKQNIFNGRVVMVKSTGANVDEFVSQDGLYTQCIKGVVNEKPVEEYIINAAVSKVLSAIESWAEILKYAEAEEMQIIISNTTEVGIILKADDDIKAAPPQSYPAKLLAFLHHRFQYFRGNSDSGMVIISTELIVDNGTKLKEIILQFAAINKLDKNFIEWINNANDFCNSLVDRIVPGALKNNDLSAFKNLAGYSDNLAIMSEPYSLWAIQSSSEKTKQILSFYKADESIIIASNINKFRELKLRLLNGTHTFSCGLSFLAGFNFVSEAMQVNYMQQFIKTLMLQEIIPSITGAAIHINEAKVFANQALDRFSNPYIQHKWLSITMQFTAKMKMRNVPLLLAWYKLYNKIPVHMAAGFAAYILFMKPVKKDSNIYYGKHNENHYKIEDDKVAFFYSLWQQNNDGDIIAEKILSNVDLWESDLTTLNGFAESVKDFMKRFVKDGYEKVLSALN